MFTKLVEFGLAQSRRPTRGPGQAITHSNDNLPGLRRPQGRRRIPTSALACHWIDRNGRLECRWQAEPNGDTPIGDFDEHGAMGRVFRLSSVQPSGRSLALAG